MGKLSLCVILFFCVVACSFDSGEIPTLEVGQDFVDSNVRLIVLDTFELTMSTFKFDSINTSSSNRLLFGKFLDDYFGTVESRAFFELVSSDAASDSNAYDISSDAELDSVALILGYDDYFYQDTTKVIHLNVHKLLEEVVPEEGVFYNTSSLSFDSIPLIVKAFLPEPLDEDSLHISLPNEFGQDLFDKILDNEINNNSELRDNLPGFVLVPGAEDNGSVIGFSRNQEDTYLRFFYSIPEEFDDTEEVLDLVINPFSSTPTAFHNVQSFSGQNGLDMLDDQETELPSTASGDLTFIQSATGFATKVTFPNIKSLYDIPGTGTLLSAQLHMKPLREAVTDDTPLRDSLSTAVIDVNNVIIEEIRTGTGLVQGVLVGEGEEFGTVIYEVPIGIFLDQKLNESPETENALVLFNENFNETVNRLVLQGETAEDFRARIVLTYAIYDE
ncbi:DUF4270 domain-containing protein [Muricauda sp. SCSIO 64092]|uniref:DUF4270 family protein n=1 Tax=Allomuricauda sp. SCSIO 64092 TaxID=2908842 RepID=UPI001FF6BC1F|nr:DUF4270 family protein [Muricauda sp. SCSIO 64092]UOY08976.1 DUF4270 domain-containing protein [Muricauda sp. SCSIO 64092]